MTNPFPLEPNSAEMQRLARHALELLVAANDERNASPAGGSPLDPELLRSALTPPPEHPRDIAALLELLGRAAEQSYQTSGPSYLAYIPGGGIFSAALAAFMAAGLNRYTGKVATAPVLVAMEESILRWMCDLFNFPAESQALLTTGGSMSNLIAIAAARTAHAKGSVDRATVYVGQQGHGSVAKAAWTAGIAPEHVRVVPSTSELRLDVGALRALLRSDRDAGLTPVCVVATAGTTNTGTIDPLEDIAAVTRSAGAWLHVDGAYGGLFQLTERGRARLAGIGLADSITLDPHKALFLPFGTGAIVVRAKQSLHRTFATQADYMQDLDDAAALPDFDLLSPELTRDFRGLRVWLPLHLHGVGAFREQLDEKLSLAASAYQALREDPRLELPWAPDLSVVVFRLRGRDDAAQLSFLERINHSQRVLLSSTRIDGRVYLRLAILCFRTHADRVEEALQIIQRAAGEG